MANEDIYVLASLVCLILSQYSDYSGDIHFQFLVYLG